MTNATSQWDILTGDPDRDRRNVRLLLESVEALYSPRAWHDVIRHALDRAIEVTGAQRGIVLLESTDGDLEAELARSAKGEDLPLTQRYSRSVVDRAWTTSEAQQMVDAEDQSAAQLGQSILDLRLLSIMATPLQVKGRILGVLYVDSTLQAKEFTKGDFAVFKALGGMAAVAIENGRLMEERAATERMSRELAVAREIQQRLFPKDIVNPDGFEIAGVGIPCEETSGDYYDVIPLEDGRVALVVGDVAGHGIGPALFMTQTRALLHTLLVTLPNSSDIITNLNAALERDMPPNVFMTLFLGVLDPVDRSLSYVSGGHNPPFIVRTDSSVEELRPTGQLLGVRSPAVYETEGPIPLDTGDVVMLYTDGIFEAKDPTGQMYGEKRLVTSFVERALGDRPAQHILDSVVGDLLTFCKGEPLEDDLTALVVRVL